jgi:hypothetical protein
MSSVHCTPLSSFLHCSTTRHSYTEAATRLSQRFSPTATATGALHTHT